MNSKSSRSIDGKNFTNFEMSDARIACALNKISQKSHFKKKGQPGGTESSERGPVSTRKTDRLDDHSRVGGAHETVLVQGVHHSTAGNSYTF